MSNFDWMLPELSHTHWMLHILVFAINITLLLAARPIVNLVDPDKDNEVKISIFRTLNALVLVLHLIDLVFLSLNKSYENYFIRLGLSLMAVYAGLFVYSLCCYLSRKRFGIKKTLDGNTMYLDSYSSRLVDIMLLVVVALTTIYILIKIWGADSMLETTGIFGIVFAFLAFTSNIWAPDIISGLIILNTEMLVDGDVVLVDGHPDEYIISKVTLIYVILYDVQNNHRTLIRNNQFIRNKIDNLSRIASTDGIRQSLKYKIAYPKINAQTKEQRKKQFLAFKSQVDRMFALAEENCLNKPGITINHGSSFEWAMTSAGDYALEYTLWIYLERIPNTKVTAKIRKHLMGTIHKVNEAVYYASIIEGLDLSTPTLNQVSLDANKEQLMTIATKETLS
ncbi:MAG: hypothetical protein ACJAS1_000478 [Oleiphilaceae bacterium]